MDREQAEAAITELTKMAMTSFLAKNISPLHTMASSSTAKQLQEASLLTGIPFVRLRIRDAENDITLETHYEGAMRFLYSARIHRIAPALREQLGIPKNAAMISFDYSYE